MAVVILPDAVCKSVPEVSLSPQPGAQALSVSVMAAILRTLLLNNWSRLRITAIA